MPAKKNFVLRIDDETFKLLEKWAADEFRSVNGQIEFLLHESLLKSGRKKK
ncbi:Arc family DNA-binding protein [uncultured Chryseobacterium sp.]|uniref:Arc family DNA-binding protein n=1 Tax=uncultured Chryseobacterium sp. TaxID=259322 RepID=UPI00345C4402